MRSFDLKDDLEFELHGETFAVKTLRPEVIAAWEDLEPSKTSLEAVKRMDDTILEFLADGNGQHEKWRKLRESDDPAITTGQMRAILDWIVEVQSARPTELPAPSPRGRGNTGRSSTDG